MLCPLTRMHPFWGTKPLALRGLELQVQKAQKFPSGLLNVMVNGTIPDSTHWCPLYSFC